MEEKKGADVGATAGAAVFSVQLFNPTLGERHQGFVDGQCFLTGIQQIGQQREAQVFVLVGEVANLQPFKQIRDGRGACEHGRNHDQGARLRRDSFRKIHAG